MVFMPNGSVNTKIPFINRSNYILHLQTWLKYFPRENILILDGDEQKTNPVKLLRQTEEFLGLEHYISEDMFVFDEEKGFPCVKTNSSLGENNRFCMGSGKGREHPVLHPTDRKRLEEYFKPYNKAFFRLFGRTLNW